MEKEKRGGKRRRAIKGEEEEEGGGGEDGVFPVTHEAKRHGHVFLRSLFSAETQLRLKAFNVLHYLTGVAAVQLIFRRIRSVSSG